MDAKFISRGQLPEWLRSLAARFEVLAPARAGSSVIYRPVDPAAPPRQPELAVKPTESAKRALFPLSEALLTFAKNQPDGKPGLELRETPPPRPCLVFGLPSCDARGFLVFDPVYAGSGTAGKFQDNYYLRRREQAVLIVKTCPRPLSTCFCNWVGGGPASAEGADVLATELKDGLVLEAITGKGSRVLDSTPLRPAADEQLAAATQSRAASEAAMPAPVDLSGCARALRGKFDSAGFWQGHSAGCLSCGACTCLCPTCYCFDLSDEERGSRGVRLRSWDSCMLPLFTQETGGHNPRAAKAARLRNRISHKVSFYPDRHPNRPGQDGHMACCGCGRCIRSCPSAVDIRRIVTEALGTAAEGAE
jgi:ferredoxin